MKELEMDPQSRLYKFVTRFGGLDSWDIRQGNVDTCQFKRALIMGGISVVLMSLVCLVAAAVLALVFGSVVAWAAYCIIHHMWLFPDILAAFGLLIIAGLSIVGLIMLTSRKLREKHLSPFETELYYSFKEKYCKKIVLKDIPAE